MPHFLRTLALGLAGAAALSLPAAAQGLRPSPLLGGRPATPSLATQAPRAADFIVAVVNSEPITNNEVRLRMLRFEQQLAQQGSAMPPRGELARQVLERLIQEKAQLQLARETGVKVDEAMVDAAELNIARQNQINVMELRSRLAADGMSLPQFREDLRNQILLQRLRDRELESRVRVTELDIDQFLREQERGDASTEEINLAHVLIPVPENAPAAQVAELEARAKAVQARAKAGADIAVLVRENAGGVVGLRTPERLPPLFVEATRSLPAGGVTEVLRSAAGFHVVKVLERKQSGGALAVTQSRARHILLRPDAQLSEAAARQRLLEFRQRIQAGQADFAALAREHSQDASARNGGDLGWANPGLFVPEFEEAMNALQPGQIAEPVTSRFGVHLIQLVERRQTTLSQREQRELARNLVREKKLDEAYAQWAQEVRGRAYVEYREPPQ